MGHGLRGGASSGLSGGGYEVNAEPAAQTPDLDNAKTARGFSHQSDYRTKEGLTVLQDNLYRLRYDTLSF